MLLDSDRCKVLCLSRNNELCKHKRRKKPQTYLGSSSAEKDLWLLWITGWTGADSFSGLTMSAVAKRADAMLWCINKNIMCDICVAALTPFTALLPSQLEHPVQPSRLLFREDTEERSVVRALSETSQGEGTGQKTKWYSNPSRADIRKDFLSQRVMKPWWGEEELPPPRVSRSRLARHWTRGAQACLASGGPFWPQGSAIRRTLVVTLVLAKQTVPRSIAGTRARPTPLLQLSLGQQLAGSNQHIFGKAGVPAMG